MPAPLTTTLLAAAALGIWAAAPLWGAGLLIGLAIGNQMILAFAPPLRDDLDGVG